VTQLKNSLASREFSVAGLAQILLYFRCPSPSSRNEIIARGGEISIPNLQNSVTLMPFVHKSHTQFNIYFVVDGRVLELPPLTHPMPTQPPNSDQPQSGKRLRAFLTGAIVAGSALLGGLAVVLWNRKALSGLRHPAEPREKPSNPSDDEEE
jgi:hypothetical protein